jgi:hypothetical protein
MLQQSCNGCPGLRHDLRSCVEQTPGGRMPSLRREQGAVLIFVALLLVAVLAVVALAIDSGNLYHAQLALQRAVDAAALDAVNYTLKMGKTEFLSIASASDYEQIAPIQTYLEQLSTRTVHANLDEAGYPRLSGETEKDVEGKYSPPGSFTGEENSGTVFEYEVSAHRKIHYLLADKIPLFSSDSLVLAARAKARRNVANIALILDVSNSMNCPVSGSCDCLATNSCPSDGNRRMDALASAVKKFMLMFDNKDRIILVPFNIMAGTPVNWQAERESYGFDPETTTEADIQSYITDLFSRWVPRSNTNICDAFMQTHAEMNALVPNAQAAYVFFSDGAPTAARLLFSEAAANGKPIEPRTYQNGGGNTHDYLSYSLQWKNNPADTVFFTGPSVLTQSGMIRFDYQLPEPPSPGFYGPDEMGERASFPSDDTKGCGPDNPSPVLAANQRDTAANDVFSPCLNSLEAQLPNNPSRTYGSNYSGPAGFGRWQEQYYNCAIELADDIRAKKGTFYVIGLGDKELNPADPTDPYQNAGDTTYRKDHFLARVANDYEAAVPAPKPWPSPRPTPLSFAYDSGTKRGYVGYKGYENSFLSKTEHRGKYLATSNADELRLLFEQIARKIKLKLAS